MNDQNGNSKCQAPTKLVRWTWTGLGVLLLALFIALRALPVAQWLTEFNRWIAHLGIWGILLFIVGYILATVLFFPASVLTVGAGFVFGVFLGTVTVSIAATTGAALAFLTARYFARDKIEQKVRVAGGLSRSIERSGNKVPSSYFCCA
jgi:uncharacterized membrane protein YdjX (TVP38/TMEM64 family)